MERLVSDEEKIRRAEDIIERRRNMDFRISGEELYNNNRKVKKMIIQIILCLLLYCGIYYIKNCPDDNSKNIMTNINNLLQQDVDFNRIYSEFISKYNSITDRINNHNNKEKQTELNNGFNGENIIQDDSNMNGTNEVSSENAEVMGIGGSTENIEEVVTFNDQISDAEYIKNNFKIINPLPNSIVTSRFGSRESTEIVSANHKGIDLGALTGTDIISCMDGEIIEVSAEGDFGLHVKISNNDIVVIYGHCSEILVEKGKQVSQGEKIAKVGSTGKATGPHLHFEIRRDNKAVNPEDILQF